MDTAKRETWHIEIDSPPNCDFIGSPSGSIASCNPLESERIVKAHNSGALDVDMDALRTLLTRIESMIVVQDDKCINFESMPDNGPISKVLRSLRIDILRGEIAMLSDLAAKLRAAGVA